MYCCNRCNPVFLHFRHLDTRMPEPHRPHRPHPCPLAVCNGTLISTQTARRHTSCLTNLASSLVVLGPHNHCTCACVPCPTTLATVFDPIHPVIHPTQ